MTPETDKKNTKARNNAYSLLRSRPRAEREIRDRLRMKKYDDGVIEDVISRLKSAGEIDDAKFAKFWVESRMRMNPVGDAVLKHELKAKGVDQSIIDLVLEEKKDNFNEYEIASGMARERFARFAKLDRRKAMKRLYDFLQRRGFSFDTVERIVADIIK
ncbi:MAG: regulatory protein RecX [Candidatus Omnitrophota bacterium]